MSITAHNAKAELRFGAARLPADGYYLLFGESDGALDYAAALAPRKIAAWPEGPPDGWGQGRWGYGCWGLGGSAAGWGEGPWGYGPWGFGCPGRTVVTPPLADGDWDFAIVGYDALGNADPEADRVEASVTLAGTPEPPGAPEASWAAGTLTLSYELSTDDDT